MKLIYLGTELDSSKEHALFPKNEFGFKVTVTYDKNSSISKHEEGQVVDTFNNVTEVHNRFERMLEGDEPACAFESDIHSTGCYRALHKIESIVVELATEKTKDFGSTDVILPDSFKEQIKNEFIPAIERMVKKQEEHIEFLRKSANKIKYRRWFNSDTAQIDDMIDGAEKLMLHLKKRLEEYNEYANTQSQPLQ